MVATRQEFSAGGVVFKSDGPIAEVVLIARKGKTVWCLPKGKVEEGETTEAAAAREITEETGITAELRGKLGDITYFYVSPVDRARVSKRVRFFLFRYLRGFLSSHDREVDDVGWFKTAEALKVMTYPSEREIMRSAEKQIGLLS